MTNVVMETTDWRRRFQMPQTIKEAKARREELARLVEELRTEAAALFEAFRAAFPNGSVAVYLARSPDKSHTPLRWRLGPASGALARRRVELTSQDAKELLVRHTATVRTRFLEFDFKRLHLNYKLATATYELERLDAFIRQYEAWRVTKNALWGVTAEV